MQDAILNLLEKIVPDRDWARFKPIPLHTRRRRGMSAKSPRARKRSAEYRPARRGPTGEGTYAQHDELVRLGMDLGEQSPSKRSWAGWKAALAEGRA